MRVLFLSPRQCWPTVTGAKLREYHLLRGLARSADVTHVFFSQAGEPAPAPADLPFCREIVSVPPPSRYTTAKVIRGVLGRWPLPVVNYTSPEMRSAVGALLGGRKFDLVHMDSIHMAAYAPMLPEGTPVVYDWHNIESEVMRRHSTNAGAGPHALYAALTARRLAALEGRILRRSFGHIVCSARELEQLRPIAPRARVAVIANGVDTRFFEPCDAPGERRRIVFVGSMAYHANVEAAVFFVREVWPAIRERFPRWRLTLVGSEPAPAVVALGREEHVEVTGTTPDLRPYYREAVASVVPLRTGGGTRLKILEAMAAGVPVVSSELGAEGLAVSPGVDILIARTNDDWLEHLSALSSRAMLWNRLARAGRELVCSRYEWEPLGQLLYETYARWLSADSMSPPA